jgi:hypothetical protein
MLKNIVTFLSLGLIVGCNPLNTHKNYYNDLSKGTDKIVTSNENNIINALIKYRTHNNTNEIVIISDSTDGFKIDTTRIISNDTFPAALIKMMNQINDKNYYIGNSLLTLSNDYRYFPHNYWSGMIAQEDPWKEFCTRFPESKHGILSFSKIAINADSTMAIAYVFWAYQMLGADGGLMSFKRENGIWKVIKYLKMVVS